MSQPIKEEESRNDRKILHAAVKKNESVQSIVNMADYLVLSNEKQALTVAKFPKGCRVLHSVMSKEGTLRVCFCSVEAVAIHLPSRGNSYKVQSDIADGPFVMEEELSFGPETPVWAILSGKMSYTTAIVVSLMDTKLYTVIECTTHDVHHDVRHICFRTEGSNPPKFDASFSSPGPKVLPKNHSLVTPGPASTTDNSVSIQHCSKDSGPKRPVNDAGQTSQKRVKMENDPHFRLSNSWTSPPSEVHCDHERRSSLPFVADSSRDSPIRYIRVPKWANLKEIKERVIRERNHLKNYFRCFDIDLDQGFFQPESSEATIKIVCPRDTIEELTRVLQVMVAESVPESDRTLLMHELAFLNPDFSELDGDYAFTYFPNHYLSKKWIAVIPLPVDETTNGLLALLIGKEGKYIKRVKETTRCSVLATDGNKEYPHVLIISENRQSLDDGVAQVQERLQWADGWIHQGNSLKASGYV